MVIRRLVTGRERRLGGTTSLTKHLLMLMKHPRAQWRRVRSCGVPWAPGEMQNSPPWPRASNDDKKTANKHLAINISACLRWESEIVLGAMDIW